MDIIIDWISKHYEWIFSGIGVFLISLFFLKKGNRQNQKSGNNSTNIQVGGDLNIKDDK
ncbi:hypothetical protein [Aliarcobacter butzleri]|uniref:hypothetical protein n=1 Tax=Aliarcobacter butzleri TaxID=28197 RepID=UPI001EDFCEBC|nr:hypothetical protein [Aliarcobacter butzleri]MCG3697735.1 hypothetical protein [Aliarcobacter butzleri]